MTLSLKPISLIFTEAVVVGIFLILFVKSIRYIYEPKDEMIILFLAGFLFHIAFEYSGINLWYSLEYCKLVKS